MKHQINRRSFLTIAAAAAAAAGPVWAATSRWRGIAFGSDAEISLRGPEADSDQALTAALDVLERAEALFSLYRPDSMLSVLNRDGRIAPQGQFVELLRHCDRIHHATGGQFDPTVQPLWQALARGGDIQAARDLIGWGKVAISPPQLALGQALTLNGIAQGFATDMVSMALADHGFTETLINIGEFRAGDGHWQIGIEDPGHGPIRQANLTRRAIATSSPNVTMVGGIPHILAPKGTSHLWSTISVEADTAVVADGFSTAFCLMDLAAIEETAHNQPDIHKVTLVQQNGDTRVLST